MGRGMQGATSYFIIVMEKELTNPMFMFLFYFCLFNKNIRMLKGRENLDDTSVFQRLYQCTFKWTQT